MPAKLKIRIRWIFFGLTGFGLAVVGRSVGRALPRPVHAAKYRIRSIKFEWLSHSNYVKGHWKLKIIKNIDELSLSIKIFQELCYAIQLTPHWGFSVADYIKYYAYF